MARGLGWLAVANMAWSGLLVLESTGADTLSSPTTPLLLLMAASFGASVLLGLPLAALHLALHWLRGRTSRWLSLSALLAAVGAGWPAHRLAGFLCSGDWISTMSWAPALHVAILAVSVAGAVAIWIWHLLCDPSTRRLLLRSPGPIGSLARSPVAAKLLPLAGLLAASTSWWLLTGRLSTYSMLVDGHALAMWLVVATTANTAVSLVRSPSRIRLPLTVGVLFAGAAAALVVTLLPRPLPPGSGTLSEFSSGCLFWHAVPSVRFDLSDPSTFHCDTVAVRATALPLSIPDASRRNVILVTIESLRADHIGRVIGNRPVAQNIANFARSAQIHDRAHTTYPATLFAFTSAFTGRYAAPALLSPEPPPSILAAIRDRFDEMHLLLPDDDWFDLPALDRWIFQGIAPERLSDAVAQTRRAIDLLSTARARNRRLFLWMHYYEPHPPYRKWPGLDFGGGRAAAYASEVAYVDRAFGDLAAELHEGRWYEDSLVIVMADHGQALGESGYFGHHVYLTRPLTAIPLFVRFPGATVGSRDALASIADIAPTVLHFIGQPIPAGLDGLSLLRSDDQRRRRHVIAEAFPLRGRKLFEFAATPLSGLSGLATRIETIQTDPGSYTPKAVLIGKTHRLIADRVTGQLEMYDDVRDPLSSVDMSRSDPARAERLAGELAAWHFFVAERAYCAMTKAERSGKRSGR